MDDIKGSKDVSLHREGDPIGGVPVGHDTIYTRLMSKEATQQAGLAGSEDTEKAAGGSKDMAKSASEQGRTSDASASLEQELQHLVYRLGETKEERLDRKTASEMYRAILDDGPSPADVDRALRTLGAKEAGVPESGFHDFPGYPVALDAAIWDNKDHPVHKAAAEISRDLRVEEFLRNRWPFPRQGSFAVMVLPDQKQPGESRIFAINRAANVGAGGGFPGGLLEEAEMRAGERRPYREVAEELAEISGRPEAEIARILEPLRPYLQPLASYDDPTHYLNTGGNKKWTARSYAHTLNPPPESDQKAATAYRELQKILTASTAKTAQLAEGGHETETKGASFVRVTDLAGKLDEFFYAHEAVAAITAMQVEVQKVHPGFDFVAHIEHHHPDVLQRLAHRMYQQVGTSVEGISSHIRETVRAAE